jgi:hypothetical protein
VKLERSQKRFLQIHPNVVLWGDPFETSKHQAHQV